MIFSAPTPPRDDLRKAIFEAYLLDEAQLVVRLVDEAAVEAQTAAAIEKRARQLVESVREKGQKSGGIDAFLHEYDLSSQEGVALMCIAESLLRIPDSLTADKLIQDKLSKGQWDSHLGQSHSLFVNASTWGLILTGRVVMLERDTVTEPDAWLKRLVARSGEPVIRLAMRQAMRILGHQFVMGETIDHALSRSKEGENRLYRYSFDMLGEAALTHDDAVHFYHAYCHAIETIGRQADADVPLFERAGISVKLSALHPRYQFTQFPRVLEELVKTVKSLAVLAMEHGISLTLDAEESERLDPSLDIFEQVFRDPALRGWEGLGLAVQTYQKRAMPVLDWIIDLAGQTGKRIPVRLVKGAYWDTEIKHAQEQGLEDFPVFTRKHNTDVSYLAGVKRLLAAGDKIYPQFATHNAHTIAAIIELANPKQAFEFQRLHGMGESLYEDIVGKDNLDLPCRVYAPVGGHKELLPYLVRRLLENGANTSFVNRIIDENTSVEDIIADPVKNAAAATEKSHPRIPRPPKLFGEARRNSHGLNLAAEPVRRQLDDALEAACQTEWRATPLVNGAAVDMPFHPVVNPADHEEIIGQVALADADTIRAALEHASDAFDTWSATPADKRADLLEATADLYEHHQAELMALIIREAGRTLPDALSEVREAVDFCRYYARQARDHFQTPLIMPGPTGELNQLHLYGRGVFACISPWNFPLAIFTGQIAAALASGNTVIAKPAGPTPLIAHRAIKLFYEAGMPGDVLQLLPASGRLISEHLLADPRVAGVAFTGSVDTAHTINRLLADREGAIVPLVAETGGQNAMIVDSSALPDQVVNDVIFSAFNSAGQRCSALRVLFLQEDIAPRVIELLKGAMAELRLGIPGKLATDVGPVIDQDACDTLTKHASHMEQVGELIYQLPLPDDLPRGTFFAPRVFLIDSLSRLKKEVFGPILHIVKYKASGLDQVIEQINATGYGLTLGIHSRIDARCNEIAAKVRVGNAYVNRNMIGAVVGVQPFGGQGLSGTGPKAGGPHYLYRFATERSVSVNTAALGGNTSLLILDDE